MNDKNLWQNLYQVYADFSDFIDDFNPAGLDGDTRAAILRELVSAKNELRDGIHIARAALGKASRFFSWNPDDEASNPAVNPSNTEGME